MSDDDARPRFAAHVSAPERPDIHLVVRSAIDDQINALGSVALVTGPGCRDRSATAVEQLLKSLRADRALLGEHWATDGPPGSWRRE